VARKQEPTDAPADHDVEDYATLLATRIAQAEQQREALTRAIEDMRASRRLTFTDDEHDPEGSTVSLDQARDAALLDRVRQSLAELTAAQSRLAAGSYGRCESCRQPIPVARLQARPEARWCVACTERRRR
jgi:DnaK suppressor protein